MSSAIPATKPYRILSLDGGGIRGLSSLLILEKIMESIKESENLSEVPRPCEIFDLIGGASTGGIIAIMLGRLEMTVDQCIRTYKKLAETAFTPKRTKFALTSFSSIFSAANLEAAIKQAIRENCIEPKCIEQRQMGKATVDTCPHEDLPFRDNSCTKTAVLAMTKANVETLPILFATHDTSTRFAGCSIWEIARATSAATTFFKPIKLGRDEIDFIDASFGYNNPCEHLIAKAEKESPDRQKIILSIGAGLGDVINVGDTKGSIITALKEMAVTSKLAALRLENRFRDRGGYYRFNVENGLEDMALSDWKQASEVSSHTMNYIEEDKHALMEFVRAITTNSIPNHPAQLPEQSVEPNSCPSIHYIPFHENLHFVGRKNTLSTLNDKLFGQTDFQEIALVGLGGMGKTQVALKFAYWVKRNKPDHSIFWLTMANMTTFRDGCKRLAQKLEIGDPDKRDPRVLLKDYLESEKSGKWLLILDNLDDIELLNATKAQDRITHFLPYNDKGRVLFTTRSSSIARLAVKVRANLIEVKEMSSEELTTILRRAVEDPSEIDDKTMVNNLLEQLCYIPLAVTQAADYIYMNEISASEYLSLIRTTEMTKIQLLKNIHPDETHHHYYQGAVATTWFITFQEIQKVSKPAALLLEFISHSNPKSLPQSSFPKFEEPEAIIEAIGILIGYGFLCRQQTPRLFYMHSLVHLTTQLWYKKSLESDFF